MWGSAAERRTAADAPQYRVASPTRRAMLAAPEIDPASPLLFVINAASGSEDGEAKRQLIKTALAAAGRSGDLRLCSSDGLSRIAEQAAAEALATRTAVVAVGGDGTINTVAQAAHAVGCAMGVIPQGTFNYFARTHGIPGDAAEAARMLLQAQPVPVQVAAINDRVFLVNASLGLYPELTRRFVQRRERDSNPRYG